MLTALILFVARVRCAQPEPTSIAIRNAKIVTVSGATIAKGTVVLRNGLIEAVGDNVAVPADALVIEGDGLTVYPGLVDGLSTWGMGPARRQRVEMARRRRRRSWKRGSHCDGDCSCAATIARP